MLHLNLKKKWFDMILEGKKKEEYRAQGEYWNKRILEKKHSIKHITFSNGYAKDRRQMIVHVRFIVVGKGYEGWGAEPGKSYIVLTLGDVVDKIRCD